VKDTHHHQYGLLGATAFTIIIAVVPALVVLGSLSLCLYLFQRHSRNKQLLPPMIPFSELKLSAESDKLFQGTYGWVMGWAPSGPISTLATVMMFAVQHQLREWRSLLFWSSQQISQNLDYCAGVQKPI